MRELVVQTLRVSHTVNYHVGQLDPLKPETLLLLHEFGDEFPAEPRMDSYRTLVLRAISTLPQESQRRLTVFMETGN